MKNKILNLNMRDLIQSLKTIALALILALGLNFAMAWTGPTGAPPANNTSAPVNVSNTAQIKSGGLWLGSLGTDGGAIFGGIVSANGGLIIERRTSDPVSPENGRMWLRTDL